MKGLAGSTPYLCLDAIGIAKGAKPRARVEIEVQKASGIKRQVKRLDMGANLHDVSNGIEAYKGLFITEVDANRDVIELSNGDVVVAGQLADRGATIAATPCAAVVAGTPIDLGRLVRSERPIRETGYELEWRGGPPLEELLAPIVAELPVSGERAIEVLPTHATPERLDTLRGMGFTAVSIGVQSFSDDVLRHLQRPHDGATAHAALSAAVGRFGLVDADLILENVRIEGNSTRFDAVLTAAVRGGCLLYTSDAADDLLCVELGGRRIIKKKNKKKLEDAK